MMREQLAAYAHRAWSGWIRYMWSKGTYNANGSFTIPKELAARWHRQMTTEYIDLPEGEKESDRAEADEMIKIINVYGKEE